MTSFIRVKCQSCAPGRTIVQKRTISVRAVFRLAVCRFLLCAVGRWFGRAGQSLQDPLCFSLELRDLIGLQYHETIALPG